MHGLRVPTFPVRPARAWRLIGRLACGLAIIVLAGCQSASQAESDPPIPAGVAREAARLRDAALLGTDAWELTRDLVYAAGPRFAGSEGDGRAIEWSLATLESLGFSSVRVEPVRVPRWVRGEERGEVVAPVRHAVVLAALGGSVGTSDAGLEAEVVMVDSLEALAALPPGAVSGRIVFLNFPRLERSRVGAAYRDNGRLRRDGPSAAAARGASGFLMRSLGTSAARVAHTGATSYRLDAPRIPAAALSNADADLLGHLVAAGAPVRFRLSLGAESLPDADSANVIGEIPGSDLADEIVLLSCHLDSWDITPGANDDAVGCAMVIEAARRVATSGRAPRRTVRVVLFAGEEFGLAGARAYANLHAATLGRHVLAMEADFGSGRVFRLNTWLENEALPLARAAWQLLEPLGIEWGENNAFGGADLMPLRPHRVPFLDLVHDGTHYFDVHHTIDDTLDKVDRRDVDVNVAAYAVITYLAANVPANFGRAPAAGARPD